MNEKDRIESLRKRLYSRGTALRSEKRSKLHEQESETKKAWMDEPRVAREPSVRTEHSLLKTFLIFSILFFVGSAAFGAYYFFGGKNIVSSENVDIQIQGPTAVGGGEELSLQISILNKNNLTLEAADLLIEYPDGTRAPDNLERALPRYRESLGDVAPGARVKKTVRSVLFGEENTQKSIKVTVEYRVAGSNAIFYSEKDYEVTLSSAPVSISVRSLSEVISGQEFDFSIVVSSNVTTNVNNLVLQAEYPFGFSFSDATQKPAFSNSLWELGDMRPEEERVIHITGVMTGQDNEERVFRFSVGVRDELDVKKLATTFITTSRSVTIQRPFISAQLALNNLEDTSYVFNSRERIVGEIAWKNNLPDQVSDAQIEIHFLGNALDESTIFTERGFYDSVKDTIRWSKDTYGDLASLSPSQAGIFHFELSSKNISANQIQNPEITLQITVRGTRIGEGGVPEAVTSSIVRNIKISSDLTLTSQLLRATGPFTNTGTLPAKAEKETTYTIVWTTTNVANHVSGAHVTATLPSYMRWIGVINPQNADMQFNQNTREVTWNIGEVPQGVGSSISPKEVAFQVGFTPSLSQVGQSPILIDTQKITGFDQFTEAQIEHTVPALSTNTLSESNLPNGYDRVVQ